MEAVATASETLPSGARVLLVAPPAEGGLATHVISLLAALHRDGYPLGLVCEPGGRLAEAASEYEVPMVGLTCVAGGGPARFALRAAKLARAIRSFRPHVVHTHSFGASAIGAAACGLARCHGLVVTLHNYPPGSTGMLPARGSHRWAVRMALRRARRIITVSEALRRDLILAYPDAAGKCKTVYNGIDTRYSPARSAADVRAELGVSPESRLIGMVARFAPQKGIEEFIRAVRIVSDVWPTAEFVLAGDGPLMERALEFRAQLDLERRLLLPGRVEWARDLLGALDVLVVASLSEGSSVVAMEAMALGKPVVATSAGGLPEVVVHGQTGLIVPPGDPGALAEAIVELLSHPDRAEEMGDRGRRRAVAQFDVVDMIERTKAVYADLMRGRIEAGIGR